MKPKVSVIVPVYNIEKYLQQCIESIINQTLREIEIILIDDGSTDNSGSICDKYAEQDKRIVVVHKTNQGLACARNDGISISSAPFIMFVDGDDWVEPQFCELPYKVAVEQKIDLVLITYNTIFRDGTELRKGTKLHDGLISESEAIHYNVMVSNAAWLALYERHLFDDIRFPVGRVYEDVGIMHRVIHMAYKHYLIDEALYNHRINRKGSITSDPITRNSLDYKEMFFVRIKDLLEWGYEDYAHELAFSMLIKYGIREKFLVTVLKKAYDYRPKSVRQEMMLQVFRLSPLLFDAICVLMGRRVKE